MTTSGSHSSLSWRHNERDDASYHRRLHRLLSRYFRRRSKKTSKLRGTSLCAGIHRWPVNSPHKRPVTRKMFPFDDVIMLISWQLSGFSDWKISHVLTAHFCDKHDDVIKWKHFPRYWTFEWGIHRSPVNSPHKGQWRGALMVFFLSASE